MISMVQDKRKPAACLLVTIFCLIALAALTFASIFASASSTVNDSEGAQLTAEQQYAQFNLTETTGDLFEDSSTSNSSLNISNLTQNTLELDKTEEGSIRMAVSLSNVSYSINEDTAGENIADHSTNKNTTDDTADKNISGGAAPENTAKKAEIAAYVYNSDNDELDVSLFIDSLPNGRVEVAKGSQETFGNYSLELGFHKFKITWKDSDTNEAYESELKKELSGDDAVILYTEEHIEPNKFDLTVSVKNENDKATNAYLYIDKSFETTQELSEDSTTAFSKVSVEEGVHDVSIRWLDPYTNAEYEKKKRITVDDDKAVIFIATKGASFEDKGEVIDAAEELETARASSFESNTKAEDSRTATKDEADDSTGSYNGTGADDTEADDTEADDTEADGTGTDSNTDNITSDSEDDVDASEDDGNTSDTNTANAVEAEKENAISKDSVNTEYLQAFRTLNAKESPTEESTKPKSRGWGNVSFIYPLILLAASYLVFRH